jgi:DGQHR domain-containing protein
LSDLLANGCSWHITSIPAGWVAGEVAPWRRREPAAELGYSRRTRTLSFKKIPRAFLILDGQHRVYGFRLANSRLRIPVVISNNLSRSDECRLFMDINTKQRPVPNELILDTSRLAETESDLDALFHDVFDHFNTDQKSPLFGRMSPAARSRGKISRVTFNAALKAIDHTFSESDPERVYSALSSYLQACVSGLRSHDAEANITNPTLFRALVLLFPTIAEPVADRHGGEFSPANFDEIVGPLFRRMKRAGLQLPGQSHQRLHETFRKTLRTGFTL